MIIKGQKINDRYEIIKLLGEGGMANVYLAIDTILNRKVAVKILRGDLANDEKFVRRFQREALAASSLSHPNIVEMYDVGEDNGNFYIVMEYIEGKNLKQLIKKRGVLTLSEIIDIMLQLTDGLSHAHDAYIIHRDIKPQNILILDNGMVKVTDFGIAMALNSSQLTQTNSIMGSVHYLPPEQAAGKGSTIKSDIYSLGILMFELLTGNLPFKGENAVEIALKHMKDPIPSVRKEKDYIPQSIENIIIKATAKNPKNRYDNAKEMYQDLKTALDKERKDELRHVYKYLEQDLDNTKVMPVIKENVNTKDDIVKPVEDNEYKPNKKLFIILGGIFIGLCAVLFAIFLVIPILTEVPDLKIPNISNMSVQSAENKLIESGFKVNLEIKKISSDIIEEGKVVKTEPAIGRLVKEGTIITLYQSTGINYIEIEDYIGEDYDEVRTLLLLKGIEVQKSKKEVDDVNSYRDNPNIIIDQSVESGTKLEEGDEIILYLPNVYDVYPDMVTEEWTLNDVELFAEEYGLNLTIEYEETDEYVEGIVISQNRSADTKIISGASFKVIISQLISFEDEIIEDEEEIEEE